MTKLVLIDGNAIMHRAYHALPPLTTKKGEPINAVYGLVSMLLNIISLLKPTHVAVCFDRPEPTFRKKILKSYQAQRPQMDDDLIPQFPKAKEVLKAMNIGVFEKAGFEADDLLGSIVEQAAKSPKKSRGKSRESGQKIEETVIVTGDKDIFQLVSDSQKVGVYMPARGLTNAQLYNEERVKGRLGILPSQIVDYKALVGDSSDNYPGVRGIGPITAEKLINQFGDFHNIYRNIDKLPEKTKQILMAGKTQGEMSYRLAKIKTDVLLKIDFKDLSNWQVSNNRLLELFAEFGFKALTRRVLDAGKLMKNEKQLGLL